MSHCVFFKNFNYAHWTPQRHIIIKNKSIQDEMYEKGYFVLPDFLNNDEIERLIKIYKDYHDIEAPEGGLFVSVYSKDLNYRKKIHQLIYEALHSKIDSILTDYKLTVFSYIVKYPGVRSEMFIHQDMGLVNEFKHSEVSIWLPLQDVDINNGTMGILPYSHFTIPPHRSLHHDLPYSKVYDSVMKYIQPLKMSKGSLLLYDPRLVHNSFANLSHNLRMAVAGRFSPQNARYCICYRNEDYPKNHYELIEVNDDFMINFDDFIHEKIARPGNKTIDNVIIKDNFVTEEDILKLASYWQLPVFNHDSFLRQYPTASINEPETKNPTSPLQKLWKHLLRYTVVFNKYS